jgi:hypothetical protein
MSMHHSFDIEHARLYGLEEAVFISNLQFWISKNAANGIHLHDGRTWTYNSAKAFTLLFPYLSPSRIRRTIDSLENQAVVLKGNYSPSACDRTLWLAFVDEDAFLGIQKPAPKSANGAPKSAKGGTKPAPKSANGCSEIGKSLIGTDINTEINLSSAAPTALPTDDLDGPTEVVGLTRTKTMDAIVAHVHSSEKFTVDAAHARIVTAMKSVEPPATPEAPKPLSAFRLKLAAAKEAREEEKAKKALAAAADKELRKAAQADLRKATWAAFDAAYQARYGTTWPRNMTTNSQMVSLVERLGQEAPDVAAFYLRVNDAYIVRNTHSLGLLVSGAESYKTQWFTGQSMTATRAQQADKTQSNLSAADEAIAMLRARRGENHVE